MKDFLTQSYPESHFGGFSDIDGTVVFYTRVNALLQPSFTVVDFGCGRGEHAEDPIPFRRNLRSLKGKVSRVIGIDVDDAGLLNPTVDEFRKFVPGGGRCLAAGRPLGAHDHLRFCNGASSGPEGFRS
jgi:hypothetical protein